MTRRINISSILDDGGQLWLGGGYFAIHLFDKSTRQTETFFPRLPADADPADRNVFGVQRIIRDQTDPDILWLGINELGLMRFDRITHQSMLTGCQQYAPWQDTDGMLWSGSFASGLIGYNPASGQCTQIPVVVSIPKVNSTTSPPTHDVIRVGEELWVGAPHGIVSLDRNGHQALIGYDPENDDISKFFIDRDSRIWCGPFGGPIKVYDPHGRPIQFFSLNAFEPTERYYPSWQIYDPVQQRILAVHGWRNKVYVISMDHTRSSEHTIIPAPSKIRGMVVDPQKTIWLAGTGNLYTLDRKTDQLKRYHSPALAHAGYDTISPWQLDCNAQGDLTILGYDGFIFYDPVRDKAAEVRLQDVWDEEYQPEIFWSHSIDADGNIWLTTESVIARFDPSNGDLLKFKNFLPGHHLGWRATVMDHANNIWMVGNTLEEFKLQNDSLIHMRTLTSPGIPKNLSGVHLHVGRDGRIWCFGQNGLFGVDPVTDEVRAFGLDDGLDNMYLDPLQSVDLPDGRILSHCGTGVMLFHPDSLWHSADPPQSAIVLKQVRVSGSNIGSVHNVSQIATIRLHPYDDFLDIHYRAIVLPRPRKVSYSYKVKGISDEWIFHGQNETVTLTGLTPGRYTFCVKTGLPDTPSPVTYLDIAVATPYYLQAWFILLVAAIASGLVYWTYQNRIRRITREEALKTDFNKKLAEVELQALRAQMNPHFMFNSLNSIKSYILKAGPLEAAEYLTNFSSLIRSILDNSREKQISLQKELDALLLYIDLEKMRFPDKFDVIYTLSDQVPLEDIMTPPLILQPYVENAIWHGLLHKEEKGVLMLNIRRHDDRVICLIEDDGIGRKMAMEVKKKSPRKFKSMGMGITRDRIELHNKLHELGITVAIEDKEDDQGHALGTKVIITFPIPHRDA